MHSAGSICLRRIHILSCSGSKGKPKAIPPAPTPGVAGGPWARPATAGGRAPTTHTIYPRPLAEPHAHGLHHVSGQVSESKELVWSVTHVCVCVPGAAVFVLPAWQVPQAHAVQLCALLGRAAASPTWLGHGQNRCAGTSDPMHGWKICGVREDESVVLHSPARALRPQLGKPLTDLFLRAVQIEGSSAPAWARKAVLADATSKARLAGKGAISGSHKAARSLEAVTIPPPGFQDQDRRHGLTSPEAEGKARWIPRRPHRGTPTKADAPKDGERQADNQGRKMASTGVAQENLGEPPRNSPKDTSAGTPARIVRLSWLDLLERRHKGAAGV
jgi:hypothetical protein